MLHSDFVCVFPVDITPHMGRHSALSAVLGSPRDSAIHAGACVPKHLQIGLNEPSRSQCEAQKIKPSFSWSPCSRGEDVKSAHMQQQKKELGIPGPNGSITGEDSTRGGCHRLFNQSINQIFFWVIKYSIIF